MSKDCDVFSDSYGCVITKSIGYQSPFPIVRLGNGHNTSGGDDVSVQGACFTSVPAELHASRARLLTLQFSARDSCVSFLQLMDGSRRPLELDSRTAFIKKVETSTAASAVVSRCDSTQWSTSLYVTAHTSTHSHCRRVLFRTASSVSLRESSLWLTETAKEEGCTRQLHHYAVEAALAGALPTSLRVEGRLGQPLDVVALTANTAVVLGTGGLAVADRRHSSVHAVGSAPVANGGVAGDDKAVTFGEDYVLRVFDLRNTSTPLMESSTSSYLCVKAVAGCRAALLVTDDVVGVLDVRTLTITASLQHSGDRVLDATLLPRTQAGVRLCTTTESGMLYDWTVAT